MLFWQKAIKVNNDFRFNFAIRNILTSFGNDISLNVFLQKNQCNFVFIYHHANNYEMFFPSLETELFEHPVFIGNSKFLFSPRVLAGIQPKNQSFTTSKHEFMGQIGCRIDWFPKGVIKPYFELYAKTDGWIAGNAYLNSNLSVKFGLTAWFY